jgi:hypothetical protein
VPNTEITSTELVLVEIAEKVPEGPTPHPELKWTEREQEKLESFGAMAHALGKWFRVAYFSCRAKCA